MLILKQIAITEPRPIYYIYSGMGSQWPGMAQKLMAIPAINESLIASSKTLDEFGQDVYGEYLTLNIMKTAANAV